MKKCLLLLMLAGISCKNVSDKIDLAPPQAEFEQPVIQPLKFSKGGKIEWADIKPLNVQPIVKKLNWDKLPQKPYDTSDFKPFTYPVTEKKFDYNALPAKNLDIDKLASHDLKFKTYILPAPKLIKGATLQLRSRDLFVFDFGEAKGKSEIQITYLFNDRDGLLWIATTQGLYCYDGESLSLILADPSIHLIMGMVQDNMGNFWIGVDGSTGGFGGIVLLGRKSGLLKKCGLHGGLSGSGSNILRLMKDSEKRIWITSSSTDINIVDPETQTAKWLNKSNGLSIVKGSAAITEDKNKNIWIANFGGGADILDLKNKKIKYLDKTNGLTADVEYSMTCDHLGRIWIGLRGGLINVVNLEKKTVQTIRDAQSTTAFPVISFLEDNRNRIWVCTSKNGLEIINAEKYTIRHMKKNDGLAADGILEVAEDSERQLWLGSYSGLNMTGNNKDVIEHIGKDSINALWEDQQGLIWKSTPKGVDILDRKTKKSRHLGIEQGLEDDHIQNIIEESGSILIKTDSDLEIIDSARKTISHFNRKYGLDGKSINDIIIDKNGLAWIGLNGIDGGIDIYDRQKKTIKHLGEAQGLARGGVDHIAMDNNGQISTASSGNGIDRINPITGEIWHLNSGLNFKFNTTTAWLTDSKGNMWIGTEDGIFIIDPSSQKFIVFTIAEGLINDQILSLIQHKGRVYAGTNLGITVIAPPAGSANSRGKWQVLSHGLQKMWIDNSQGDLITKDGLYWSGDIGINVLDLSKKSIIKSFPYVTGISVFDQPVYFVNKSRFNSSITDTLWELNGEKYYVKGETPVNKSYALQCGLNWDNVSGPGNMPTNLRVPYNQNFIQFHYSSFNFMPHDTTAYRYILNGADKKWSDITSDGSTVNYMNLRPGEYTFEVISRDADNVWSQPARFNFTISPPWWQTWWAYILYVGLFASTLWCLVYLRSLQLLKEKRKLERQVQIRTEEVLQQKEEIEAQRDKLEMEKIRADIAADFHDELGSTLSSIALYSEMAITGNQTDERTKNILSLIGESSRGTVSAMQDMIWTIQPKNDKMQEVIYRMREYAYPLAELKKISLAINAPEDVQAILLPMDIRKNMYLVFKEALNNAFKYAEATQIDIDMWKQDNLLCMRIKDDGKGFDPSDTKTGNGLINMQKRARQTGGALVVESIKGSGTEILLSSPIG